MSREGALAALRAIPPGTDFVWDGKDEDDRPATDEELQAGIEAYRKKRGRPVGSGTKEQVAIRFDRDVVEALRATGPGWQTRVSDAVTKLVKAGRL